MQSATNAQDRSFERNENLAIVGSFEIEREYTACSRNPPLLWIPSFGKDTA